MLTKRDLLERNTRKKKCLDKELAKTQYTALLNNPSRLVLSTSKFEELVPASVASITGDSNNSRKISFNFRSIAIFLKNIPTFSETAGIKGIASGWEILREHKNIFY
ncbi:hypothetical protein F8M41_011885 [Gigaspora margarita]|uniref:Uncharacterized protein n=1 Tax=Gigaspora margarita TaxID=4874 RepID=A0A8H4EPV4_GIGMA|nr:hypothetical protein F8M41_011885 [Gigaspora margarita]